MRSNRISLCMIVKDEEKWLPQCFESVKGAVDEIIMVDTGSSDQSVSIARQHGAVVVSYEWNDDFAAARNAGLERASGDWILFLDADEALDTEARGQLRAWISLTDFDGLFLNIHNYTGVGHQGATVNPVLRLFKNDPRHRFEGRIHEQIAASICRIHPQAAFHITDMVIHHYGYQTAVVEGKNKLNRNLNLLQKAVQEEPGEPFHFYNLGVEHLRAGRPEQALEVFRMAKKGINPLVTSYAHLLYKYEVRCLQGLNRWQEALELTRTALELFPEYTDLLHDRGICEETLGLPEQAEYSLREALRLGPPPPLYHTEEGIGTYQSWYALGRLLEKKADLEGAVQAYVEAVRAKSSLLPPLYRIFRIMRVSGQEQQIPQLLAERFNMGSEGAVHKVLGILEQSRCYGAALVMLPDAGPQSSAEIKARMSMAEAFLCIQNGNWRQARRKLETVQRKKGEYASFAAIWIERLNWVEGRRVPGNAISSMEATDLRSVRSASADSELFKEYDGWHAFSVLCEGCIRSGHTEALFALLQSGMKQLSSPELMEQKGEYEPFPGASQSVLGTLAVTQGLIAAADEALREWAENADGRRHPCWPLVQQIRLELPGSDGFGV